MWLRGHRITTSCTPKTKKQEGQKSEKLTFSLTLIILMYQLSAQPHAWAWVALTHCRETKCEKGLHISVSLSFAFSAGTTLVLPPNLIECLSRCWDYDLLFFFFKKVAEKPMHMQMYLYFTALFFHAKQMFTLQPRCPVTNSSPCQRRERLFKDSCGTEATPRPRGSHKSA